MKVPSLSIFTLRSRLHEGNYGSGKYFLLKMITTYVVGLGLWVCMGGFLVCLLRLISYHTCLFGSSPLFLVCEGCYHPNIKLVYKHFCHCIEEKQSNKYTDNFFLRLRLLFRRLVEGVVFLESSYP